MMHFLMRRRFAPLGLLSLLLGSGCLTKEPSGPDQPRDGFFLTLRYRGEGAVQPVLWGNFGCGWCDVPMQSDGQGFFVADSLFVVFNEDYICNVDVFDEVWAASSTGIHGELQGQTTEMAQPVLIDELVSNGQGSNNFLIVIDDQGVIQP